ncbi:hypothetical protein JYU34_019208 [Plutella xylostella]|uniref:Uncharacterized protein n=2 Tax=Plutella xylostella TaxID=51655 RepID=A0ABQ7PWA6_PLUXY|nr:uncharacterized protein LOC105391599 [Plutella xylostella]KAG7297262.1 hypothetical protein JYU34_019208 [Plutella xylostella]CAG9135580.1 unnamed protein product [Plutella xylostella]
MKRLLLLFGVVALAQCGPVEEETVGRMLAGTLTNCLKSDVTLCLKEQALKAAERLRTVRELQLTENIAIINNGPKEARSLEPLSTELEARREQVTQRLWTTAAELMENSDVEYSFDDGSEDEEESRAIGDEARSKKKKEKKKKIKLVLAMAVLAKIKVIALVVLFLGVMAASLFKIAAIVKIAFLAKIFALIKALLAKKLHHHHEEHETWIPHVEEHSVHHAAPAGWDAGAVASPGWAGGGGGGAWQRRTDAQNLAYSAHRK